MTLSTSPALNVAPAPEINDAVAPCAPNRMVPKEDPFFCISKSVCAVAAAITAMPCDPVRLAGNTTVLVNTKGSTT